MYEKIGGGVAYKFSLIPLARIAGCIWLCGSLLSLAEIGREGKPFRPATLMSMKKSDLKKRIYLVKRRRNRGVVATAVAVVVVAALVTSTFTDARAETNPKGESHLREEISEKDTQRQGDAREAWATSAPNNGAGDVGAASRAGRLFCRDEEEKNGLFGTYVNGIEIPLWNSVGGLIQAKVDCLKEAKMVDMRDKVRHPDRAVKEFQGGRLERVEGCEDLVSLQGLVCTEYPMLCLSNIELGFQGLLQYL